MEKCMSDKCIVEETQIKMCVYTSGLQQVEERMKENEGMCWWKNRIVIAFRHFPHKYCLLMRLN